MDNDQILKESYKMYEAFQNVMDKKDEYLQKCLSETEHIENQGTLVISANDSVKYVDTENKQIVTLQNKSAADTQMFEPQFENFQNYLKLEDLRNSKEEVEVSVMKESPDGNTLMIG